MEGKAEGDIRGYPDAVTGGVVPTVSEGVNLKGNHRDTNRIPRIGNFGGWGQVSGRVSLRGNLYGYLCGYPESVTWEGGDRYPGE